MFSIDLSGKAVWITGGSRGIGKATAEAFAKAGASVAITYRAKATEAETLVAALKELGTKAFAYQLDVTKRAACDEISAKITADLGKIDILVNNAGVTADNLFGLLEDAEWQSVLDTNVMGAVHCARAVMKGMMMQRSGRIINMSSAAATKGGRGQSNYAASKGALEAMSRSLAVELARKNITVNCIAPGVIATDMSAEVRKLGEQEIMDRQLMKRYGTAEEVAAWVVFLASSYGAFITGQVIHIDGGLKMP